MIIIDKYLYAPFHCTSDPIQDKKQRQKVHFWETALENTIKRNSWCYFTIRAVRFKN